MQARAGGKIFCWLITTNRAKPVLWIRTGGSGSSILDQCVSGSNSRSGTRDIMKKTCKILQLNRPDPDPQQSIVHMVHRSCFSNLSAIRSRQNYAHKCVAPRRTVQSEGLRPPTLQWPHTSPPYTLYSICVYCKLIHTGKGGGGN